MKKFIVITSIAFTDAIRKYSEIEDWELIVVGDRKGPESFPLNSTFIKFKGDLESEYNFSKYAPVDHYSRKNIGYLHAIKMGANYIYDTDDDNYPLENWKELFQEEKNLKFIETSEGVFNIYSLFTHEKIWPRGFPLKYINKKIIPKYEEQKYKVAIWQGLADNDPDVDAIFRLVVGKEIKFKNGSYGIAKNTFVPFNSQNTSWSKEAFPFLYLPCTVNFRFTDILRGYIAQRLAWEADLCLGFRGPTVYQLRNQHDLMDDFKDEFSMFCDLENLIEILQNIKLLGSSKIEWMRQTYRILSQEGIVKSNEIDMLGYWLKDVVSFY